MEKHIARIFRLLIGLVVLALLTFGLLGYTYLNPNFLQLWSANNLTLEESEDTKKTFEVIDGIHVTSGLKDGSGLQEVIVNCTACHSSKLIIQNSATREGWESMIQWMQETQGLWNLGENRELILNYLAKNYAPEQKGRRANLEDIEWYELER